MGRGSPDRRSREQALAPVQGRQSRFRADFYHLLEEFEGSDAVETVASELQAMHDAQSQVERRLKQARAAAADVLDEQIRVFETLFPGGFTGSAWQDEWRAPIDEGEARKRHVNSAVALAQVLTAEALADKTGEEVLAQAVAVPADLAASPSSSSRSATPATPTRRQPRSATPSANSSTARTSTRTGCVPS